MWDVLNGGQHTHVAVYTPKIPLYQTICWNNVGKEWAVNLKMKSKNSVSGYKLIMKCSVAVKSEGLHLWPSMNLPQVLKPSPSSAQVLADRVRSCTCVLPRPLLSWCLVFLGKIRVTVWCYSLCPACFHFLQCPNTSGNLLKRATRRMGSVNVTCS